MVGSANVCAQELPRFSTCVAITKILALLAKQKLPHTCKNSWRIILRLQNELSALEGKILMNVSNYIGVIWVDFCRPNACQI